MRVRAFVAAACVVFGGGTAWAIDDRVLGRDDVEFAEALGENRYGDLAERIVEVVERQDDAWFRQAEAVARRRLDATPEGENRERGRAEYLRARALHLHASSLDRSAPDRRRLVDEALRGYWEVDLEVCGEDPPTWLYRSYIHQADCEIETGRRDDALNRLECVIALRCTYGDADAKTGVYPIPPAARDVVDLVCDAVLAKVRVLKEAGKTADAVAAGRDYFATMPRPLDAANADALAEESGVRREAK